MVVHLPGHPELSALSDNHKLPYEALSKKTGQDNEVINPEHEILKEAESSSLDLLLAGHYSAKGNNFIADVIDDE